MLCRHFATRSVAWCALVLPLWAVAQTPPAAPAPTKSDAPAGQTTTLSLDARLVNLPVVVRDKKGALIQNLAKEDFTLTVDGHAETVRYFDKDKDLPLTLGLLVDVSQSVRNALDDERTASSAFLDQMLTAPEGRTPDRAFVIQSAHETELLQDLTASRPKLQAALKELGSTNPNPQRNPPPDPDDNNGNGGGGGGRGSRHGGGTTLYDGVFLAADELMSKQKGRKALVLLTDGEDSGSRETLNRCIEAAQRADTVVYAIYFKGDQRGNQQQQSNRGGGYPGGGRFPGGGYPGGGYPGGGGRYPGGGGQRPQETREDGKKILQRITGETGGRMFEESKKQDFAAIYTQIAEELRQQYRLGFTPDQAIMEDGYHQLDLTLPKKKDLKIQTRDGYYTGK
jgi:VWFA-related protein